MSRGGHRRVQGHRATAPGQVLQVRGILLPDDAAEVERVLERGDVSDLQPQEQEDHRHSHREDVSTLRGMRVCILHVPFA